MINKNNTAIIFGTSPFINKIEREQILYLIDNYYHIGINAFCSDYPVKNILFCDYAICDFITLNLKQEHNLIISKTAHHHNFNLEKKQIIGNIEYIFDADSEIHHNINDNFLCMYKTSALPAINYAYLKGYKNIILCGVDLTNNWNYYRDIYCNPTLYRSDKRINRMRDILYKFKDYVNLYTLNQESDLDIDKINIGEL